MEITNQIPLIFPTGEKAKKKEGIFTILKKFFKPDRTKITLFILITIISSTFLWYIFSHGYCEGEAGLICLVFLFFIDLFLGLSMILSGTPQNIMLFLGAGFTIYLYSCFIAEIYRYFIRKHRKLFISIF